MSDNEVYRWLHDRIMDYADGDPAKQCELDMEITEHYEHNLAFENLSPEAQEILMDYEEFIISKLRHE